MFKVFSKYIHVPTSWFPNTISHKKVPEIHREIGNEAGNTKQAYKLKSKEMAEVKYVSKNHGNMSNGQRIQFE